MASLAAFRIVSLSVQIADLEITTRSLLSVNSALEAAKHRHMREISSLRAKLRETRVLLRSRVSGSSSSGLPISIPLDSDDEDILEIDDYLKEGDDASMRNAADDELEGAESFRTGDEAFDRVRSMLDVLLETGKRALEAKAEHFASGGAKVLRAVESSIPWTEGDSIDDIDTSFVSQDD